MPVPVQIVHFAPPLDLGDGRPRRKRAHVQPRAQASSPRRLGPVPEQDSADVQCELLGDLQAVVDGAARLARRLGLVALAMALVGCGAPARPPVPSLAPQSAALDRYLPVYLAADATIRATVVTRIHHLGPAVVLGRNARAGWSGARRLSGSHWEVVRPGTAVLSRRPQ